MTEEELKAVKASIKQADKLRKDISKFREVLRKIRRAPYVRVCSGPDWMRLQTAENYQEMYQDLPEGLVVNHTRLRQVIFSEIQKQMDEVQANFESLEVTIPVKNADKENSAQEDDEAKPVIEEIENA